MTQNTWDVIVIGGSAAGLSAAQALGRSLRRTLVIDSGVPRNRYASHMHNVLGHDGTPPADLVARGRAEAEGYGVEFIGGRVNRVIEEDGLFLVTLEGSGSGSGSEPPLRARALVVATGLDDRLPSVPGLAERWGKSVLHCPYCHGWEVRGQRLGVLATSPMSVHHMQLVRQLSDRVIAFTAGAGELDAQVEAGLRARGVTLEPSPVVEIVGDGDDIGAVRTADGVAHPVDAIFTMSPMEPRDAFLSDLGLARSETPMGSFISVDAAGLTSNPRVWAIGNVVNPGATVPIAMAAGNLAGGAVNYALVLDDTALALAEAEGAGS